MTTELNKNIRERWVQSLFELSHFEYQKRLWNAQLEDQVGDFTECVCKYFDDLDLNDGYENFILKGIISKSDANIVAEMHNEFHSYIERPDKKNLSGDKVLKDLEWKNFTELASKTWNRLKIETESTILRGLIIEYDRTALDNL